jgi:hypothetical protein
MAKLEITLRTNFDTALQTICNGVLNASLSAELVDSSDYRYPNVRCAVRVFERYSFIGKNRVSMNVTLLQVGDDLRLSAITSGGSQAIFVKINTLGEDAFLDTLREIVYQLR